MSHKTGFDAQKDNSFDYAMAEFQRNQIHHKQPDISTKVQEIFDRQRQIKPEEAKAIVDRAYQKPQVEDIFAEFA